MNSGFDFVIMEILRSLANSERLAGDGEKGDPSIAYMNYKRHRPAHRKWRSVHRHGYCSEGKQTIRDSIDKEHKKEIESIRQSAPHSKG